MINIKEVEAEILDIRIDPKTIEILIRTVMIDIIIK